MCWPISGLHGEGKNINSLHAWSFFMLFKIYFLKIIIQEHYQSVRQFGPFSLSLQIFCVQKMSAYYVYCIYSNALLTYFIMETNTMNPYQTYCLQYWLPKYISDEQADTNCYKWWEKSFNTCLRIFCSLNQ